MKKRSSRVWADKVMNCAISRICVIGVLLIAGGCRGLGEGMPDDPLFIGRSPAKGEPRSEPPTALAYSEPEPPPAPVEMQDRPSLAKHTRPVPTPELRTPGAPDVTSDVTRTPNKVPAILTNRPK
jgi:hypothetical protein